MAASDARPIPIKNTAFRAVFPILDADGDLVTGATGLDSEVSKDQGTFADCTNEATEIATSSGMYYLDLTSTEMNADCVAVIVKTTSSGAKTTVLVFYPEETGDINVDVTAWLGTAAATPTVAGVPEVDLTHAGGTAITVASGIPEVKVNNIAAGAITAAAIATGAVDADALATDAVAEIADGVLREAVGDHSGVAGSLAEFVDNTLSEATNAGNNIAAVYSGLVISSGTIGSTGNDTTHLHLDGLTFGDDELNDLLLVITDDSASESHARWIEDWVLSTELATVATLPFTPENAVDTYAILAFRQDVTGGSGPSAADIADAVWDEATAGHTTSGTFGEQVKTDIDAILDDTDLIDDGTSGLAKIATDVAAVLVDTSTTLQGELDGIQADTEDIQTRLPAALVGGRIDATVDGTGLEAAALALINAEVDTALSDYDPPTRAEATADKNEILAYLAGLVIAKGTIGSTGNSTTALHLTGLTYGDDEINNYLLAINDVSAGEWHARYIEDWADAGDLATVATLPFTPENAVDTYAILAFRQDVTGGAGLDAAGVRAAVGLAAANLDTQLATIDGNVDSILADTADMQPKLGTPAGASISADILTIDNLVDDLESRLGTPSDLGSGATVAANLADIESQTDDIGVAGAGLTEAGGTGDHLTAIPWNAAWDAEVQSEATDALNAYDPPTKAEMDSAIAAGDDAVLAAIAALENLSASGAANAVGALVIEGAVTLIQSLRLANAANAGKVAGAATSTVTLRNLADSIDRITATVDADGNRTAVTTDLS